MSSKPVTSTAIPETTVGIFVEKIHDISEMLSVDKRKDLDYFQLDVCIESFVQHSMDLSARLMKWWTIYSHYDLIAFSYTTRDIYHFFFFILMFYFLHLLLQFKITRYEIKCYSERL